MKEELKALSLRELIGYAIFSEEEAAKFYRHLVKDFDEKSLVGHKFQSIAKDEDMHRWVLLDLHRELFGTDEYSVPEHLKPFESIVEVKTVHNLIDALETAMQNEYSAYKVYKFLAHEHKEHRKLFKYLAHFEHGHYDVLKREKEHFEDEVMTHSDSGQPLEMPHMKDYGFRAFG